MLRFSKKVDYSLQALIHIARQTDGKSISAGGLAVTHDIPVQLTAKLLQQLTREGICESRQGPLGGYRLARSAESITLGQIVKAIDGPLALDDAAPAPVKAIKCDFCKPLTVVQRELYGILERITLAQLISGENIEPCPDPEAHRPAPEKQPENQDEGQYIPCVKGRIYLDNQATTPIDPRVFAAMRPWLGGRFGNAGSAQHSYGWEAAEAVKIAREQVATVIGARARDIVWTSGATESNNLAIKGVAELYAEKGRHLVACVTEHRAVLDPLRALQERGWEITLLPVDRTGQIDLDKLRAALRKDTVLVSLMAANNEIGTLHPLAEIGAITREADLFLHVDAAQAFGKIPLDVDAMNIDLLSISGHKIYGPKGVGALYLRGRAPRVTLAPQIHGGGQERGLRSGTANVPGIVGLGEAARICDEEMESETARDAALRDHLIATIEAGLPDTRQIGHSTERLPGNACLAFPGVEAEHLLTALGGIALSAGSACASAEQEASHVLKALNLPDDQARRTLRFGIGRFNTIAEIERVAAALIDSVRQLRKLALKRPAD